MNEPTNKRTFEPFEKAIIFLYLQAERDLPPNFGDTPRDRQITGLAILCFGGDCSVAEAALNYAADHGFAAAQ